MLDFLFASHSFHAAAFGKASRALATSSPPSEERERERSAVVPFSSLSRFRFFSSIFSRCRSRRHALAVVPLRSRDELPSVSLSLLPLLPGLLVLDELADSGEVLPDLEELGRDLAAFFAFFVF